MRKSLVVLAAAALLAVAAVSAFGATTSVKWKLPTSSTVKIHKGGTVKWVWSGDGIDHSVKGPGFHSAVSSKKGFSYSHRFNKKGTFTIICGIHGSEMKTKVKVN
jgi:plastocyanin